jgi:GTP pyrophosphokinase
LHYSERASEALAYTFALHAQQMRKGSGVPYITHLLAVAALVGDYGGDEEQFIAALLHDAVEDQGGYATLEEIRARFGERVATLVDGASDAHAVPKPPWRSRKEEHVAKIARADADLKLIVAADKLHNAQSVLRDMAIVGPCVWDRFFGKRDGSLWYYRAMHGALAEGWDHPILTELDRIIRALEDAVESCEK